MTRLHKFAGVITPISLIKIKRQKMTRITIQQWIYANSVLTNKMDVNHRIGQRDESERPASPPQFEAYEVDHAMGQ